MLGDGDTRVVVEDLDFADGDVIVFNNFGGGSFRHERGGNPVSVWNDGGLVQGGQPGRPPRDRPTPRPRSRRRSGASN